MRRCRSGLWAALVLWGGLGCTEVTQLIVTFEADPALQSRAAALRLVVWTQEGEPIEQMHDLAAPGAEGVHLPVRLPIVPREGDASRRLEVVGELRGDGGEVFARQRLETGFDEGETRHRTLRFVESCEGVLCGPHRTCREGSCVGACAAGGDEGAAPEPAMCPGTACGGELGTRRFCDGFEVALERAWDWRRDDGGGVERVEQPVFRGRRALEVRIDGSGGKSFVRSEAASGVEHGSIFWRAYMFFPSEAAPTVLSTIYIGGPPDKAGAQLFVRERDRIQTRVKPEDTSFNVGHIPLDTWFCVEVETVFDSTDGAVALWLDGESRRREAGIDTMPGDGAITRFDVGATYTPTDQTSPTRFYVDEVVADTERIGCE